MTKSLLATGHTAACVLLLAAGAARAQIQVSNDPYDDMWPKGVRVFCRNVRVEPRDEKTAIIKFDITGFSGWRHDVNHDAAWVLFKVRVDGEPREWQHVRLAADRVLNPTGYGQAPGGTRADFLVPGGDLQAATNPSAMSAQKGAAQAGDGFAGVFIRRADHGEGGSSATDVTVLWDLTANPGITRDTKVVLKGYAIHMIYVAEGPFHLGSGGDETYAFYKYPHEKQGAKAEHTIKNSVSTISVYDQLREEARDEPYLVTNSAAIPTGKKPGMLWARGAEPEDGGEIPATFPNGYNAFYTMAVPLQPGEYGYFLNTISPEDADKYWHPPDVYACHGSVSRSGEAPNYWYLGARARKSACFWWMSWLDGAAFSAWAGLRPMTELEYEKSVRGPRYPVPAEAAHSFWGLSCGGGRYNAHPRERPVTVGNAVGRAFKGTHGDGTLTLPEDWPKEDAVGVGMRGSQQCASGPSELKAPWWCTSCRIDAATVDPERFITYGFRCARTAPEEAKRNSVRNEKEASPVLLGLPSSRDE